MIEVRVNGALLDALPPAEEVLGLRSGGLVWVDAVGPSDTEIGWLRDAFSLHPLVVEDIVNFNERPKVDEYPDYLFTVLIGAFKEAAGGPLRLAEIHVITGENFLVSVTDAPVPAIRALANRCHARPELAQAAAGLLFYRICDAAIDSFFPIVDALDSEIDSLETSIVERADSDTVRDIFTLKHDLQVLRRVLGPQRDLVQSLAGSHGPRLGSEPQLYLRDVYDHAVRIVEEVDSYRDIVTGALDVYLSSVSNRLGEQTRRLSVVATIFLPLTFFTGFFGQNFALLVTTISTDQAFYIGMALMSVSVAIIYSVIRRLTTSSRPLPSPAPPRKHTRNLLRMSLSRRPSSAAHDRPEMHDAGHAAIRQEHREQARRGLRMRG